MSRRSCSARRLRAAQGGGVCSDGQNNQADLCRSKGLEGFPSWEINGGIDSGVKGLDTLAELSGYKGDTDF